jgi:hypothetical protein
MGEAISATGKVAISLLLYALGCAATAGYIRRRVGEDWFNDDPTMFVVPLLWPVAWSGWLVWALLVRPTIPLIVGVYRLSAGMTFRPSLTDEEPTA